VDFRRTSKQGAQVRILPGLSMRRFQDWSVKAVPVSGVVFGPPERKKEILVDNLALIIQNTSV
jgi:hypothetical protein